MKLISVAASPFARKARASIIELGLQDLVEIVDPGMVTPVSNNDSLNDINPLGMIPALVLDNGEALYDSSAICEYLNQVGEGSLYPSEINDRYRALKLHSLANGILDLSVATRYETAMRPAEFQWETYIDHQEEKVSRGLNQLEQQCDSFSGKPTIGELTVACALGYRDFRYSHVDWREDHPNLAQWFEGMMTRESLKTTIPG